MKRFWTQATLAVEPGGFGVLLDGKPLRVPDGPPLLVPHAKLAHAIVAEWQAAGAGSGKMDYAEVPLTRLAGTAQVRIAPDPAPTAAALARYGESDLLCYRADTPPALVEREEAGWRPWLDWARTELGAALAVTSGVTFVPQHPAALAALRRALDAEDAWTLAGLGILVPALGSLVLGLAVGRGALAAPAATALSVLDDLFQAELWGDDAEAVTRRNDIATDVADAARFIDLVKQRDGA